MTTRPTAPVGWHRFDCVYTRDDGSRWSFEILAQSDEDAETRLRCIQENAKVDGRIIGEYPA
jgi:hypothetical protein